MEPQPENSSTPAATKPPGPSFVDRVWPIVRPWVEWFWLNLRVWTPFLATPDFRNRQVAYPARDYRAEGQWLVVLPKQCAYCGAAEGLVERTWERELRCCEAPSSILAVAVGLWAFFMLVAVLWSFFYGFMLACLSLLGGAAIIRLKSWTEAVSLTASACPTHADALACPETVAYDDQLFVIAPSLKIVAAAREAIDEKRRSRQAYAATTTEPRRTAPPAINPMTGTQPPPAQRPEPPGYRRTELPPIKLDE